MPRDGGNRHGGIALAQDVLLLTQAQDERNVLALQIGHPGSPVNSRSPISAAIFMSGNAARSRSRSSVRSDVCEFPAVGSSIHSSGMPMPFHVTEIIRMLIVVLPKSQFVRSIAKTHGLPPSPSNSTTTRAASVLSSRTN